MPQRRDILEETPAGHLAEAGLREVIGYQLAQAAIVTTRLFEREVGTPHDLRPVEYTLLQLIGANPGCSPVRLSKALAVTKPNITMWVDRLVARGLVVRAPSQSDKRSQELRTTPEGAALAETATARIQHAERSEIRGLSAAERAMLLELLHKLACTPG